MSFNSIQYLCFYPLVALVFFLLPRRWTWAWLLGASYVFYMAFVPVYVLLLLASTVVDYSMALLMHNTQLPSRRRLFLGLSLAANLGLLVIFKYGGFLFATATGLAATAGLELLPGYVPDILLPIGISFYTFQTIGYAVDVYRGERQPERHFGKFALYVAFFPQLVAGPIERAAQLLPQLERGARFHAGRLLDGLLLMAWGFFKKLVIADRLGVYVDAVYGAPGEVTGFPVALATYFFAAQIYCDFSGYTDIALGSARILGVDLRLNFDRPYAARSLREFWRRWHISLSTWLRDYLYIPLGGGKRGECRRILAVGVVFVLGGLWHGAAWTFVLWGMLHGAMLLAERMLARWPACVRLGASSAGRTLQRLVTFHCVTAAWLLFRAETVRDAGTLAVAMSRGAGDASIASVALGWSGLSVVSVALCVMFFVQRAHPGDAARRLFAGLPGYQRAVLLVLLAGAAVMLGATGEQAFIYFRF